MDGLLEHGTTLCILAYLQCGLKNGNNFVKVSAILIISASRYINKFATKWQQNCPPLPVDVLIQLCQAQHVNLFINTKITCLNNEPVQIPDHVSTCIQPHSVL